MQKVMNLTLSDDAFGRLFANAPRPSPGSDESISTSVGVTFSTGNGHGLQPATLPGTMIGSAMLRHRLHGGNDSPQGFFDCLSEVLAEARELSRGREVVVPRLVGMTGIRLADGLEVATPFGTFRVPREADRLLVADRTDGAKLTAILETTAPLKMFVRDTEDSEVTTRFYEEVGPILREYHRRTEQVVTMARFALLLSSEEELLAATQVSQTVFSPLQHGLAQSWVPFHRSPSPASELDAKATERVREWAYRVHANHPPQLGLSMRRLVGATARPDPADGFIDAVMCWENMFGAAPETTFRVCGAMACLLEPSDTAKRSELFTKLTRLYRKRSSVVHGATELDHRSAYDCRTQALQYALDAMRKLYDFPDLLTVDGSHDRGRNILLRTGGFDPLDNRMIDASENG
jgi:hypothetical protein